MPTVATATFNINQSVVIGTTSKCGSLGRRRCKDPSPSSSHHLRRRPHAGTGFHPDPLPLHFRGTHACLLMIFTVNQDRAEVVIITAAQSARNTVWSNLGQCSFLTPSLRMRKKQAPPPPRRREPVSDTKPCSPPLPCILSPATSPPQPPFPPRGAA